MTLDGDMASQLICKISGGQDSIQHVLDVGVSNDCYLSTLSDKLSVLKDIINSNLTELVDKEKALHASNGNRRSQKQYDDMSESGK